MNIQATCDSKNIRYSMHEILNTGLSKYAKSMKHDFAYKLSALPF